MALTVAGCGAPRRGAAARGGVEDGRRIFASACAGCHTLVGTHAPPTMGGDLAVGAMTTAQVASFTRVMPQRTALSEPEVQAVSAYVARAQRRAPPPTRGVSPQALRPSRPR